MHTVDRPATQARQRTGTVAALAALMVVTAVLRFARLGHWGFDSDEIFMLHDSVRLRLTNPRPLLYLMNHYLVLPLRPLDELGIRLLPALFGVLAVPALYLVARRLLGTRTALFAALLLTLSGLHVFYSQFGRYWSLVFLLSAVYPYAIFIGLRERDRGALATGIVTGLLASLAHPASVLLVGGPMIWLAVTYVRPHRLKALWARPRIRWGALALVALTAAVIVRCIPFLQSWIAEHDAHPGSGQFLLRAPVPMGVKQIFYLLAFVDGLTVPLVLTATVGIYLLWQGGGRIVATLFLSIALFPIAFLTLISLRTPVSTYYLLPTAPVFFMGAGYFLDRIVSIDWKLGPRWLAPSIITALVLIPGIPTLMSQYLNGRRYDFKGVAQWLEPRLSHGDVVYSDQPVALGYYLPQLEIGRLRYNTAPLTEALQTARKSGTDPGLWIVAPAPAHAFRTNLKQGGLAAWIYDHCQLRNTIGMGRVDFRQQYLQVYRCPASPAPNPATAQGNRETDFSTAGTAASG